MAAKWMGYFFDKTELKGSKLLLALAIADHADEKGRCYPGISLLAKKIRCSERQTKSLMAALVAEGWVEKIRAGNGRRNKTQLQLKRVNTTPPFRVSETVKEGSPFLPSIQRQERVKSSVRIYKEEPSIEPSIEPTTEISPDWTWPVKPFFEAFPEIDFTPNVIGFIEDRVKPGDEEAWQLTIQQYRMNFDPAKNQYLPTKIGNVINVFEAKKVEIANKRRQRGAIGSEIPLQSVADKEAAANESKQYLIAPPGGNT